MNIEYDLTFDLLNLTENIVPYTGTVPMVQIQF